MAARSLLETTAEMVVAIEDFKASVADAIEETHDKFGEDAASILQMVSEQHFRITDTVMNLLLNAVRRLDEINKRLQSLE